MPSFPSSEPKGEREKSFLWDEENRLLAVNNNGSVSCYFYDAAGERTVKLTSETEMVHVNGKKVGGNDNVCKFTAYVSPYFVVSNGGAYTKHIYAADQRIASKLGNIDGFGADPRRVEQAGGKKYDDNQSGTIKARFEALNIDYSDGNGKKDDEEYEPTMDSEEPENLVFFYHPDHLGSTSYVTDADGNIAQHIEYIPYGEVFVEERNNSFSTNYLFNAKELDNETGLYYYGARYLDPTGAMWLSVDPMWEKYMGMSPYNYCMGNPVKMVDPDGMRSFTVTKEDGTEEQMEIPDGVEGSFNIAQFDFDLLQETFNSHNEEYEDFFSALGLGTKGYKTALIARSYEGSEEWAYDKEKAPIPAGYWKCNQFVYDVLVEAGAIKEIEPGQKLPQAKDHFTNTPRLNGTYKVKDGSVKLGDVVAGKYNYSDATGHVEIVSHVYPKWKEISGNLETTAAHEFSVYKSDKGAKMLSGSEHYTEIVVRRAK